MELTRLVFYFYFCSTVFRLNNYNFVIFPPNVFEEILFTYKIVKNEKKHKPLDEQCWSNMCFIWSIVTFVLSSLEKRMMNAWYYNSDYVYIYDM